MWLLMLFTSLLIHICASEPICETLLPFHGSIPPMSIVSPFDVSTSASTVNQSEILIIKIKSVKSELRFGELMINARSTSLPYKVLGRFTASITIDGLFLINCDGVDNTAQYVNENSKGDIELQWQAPADYVGEVVFKATVVQQYEKNWVGIESAPVQIVQRADAAVKLLAPRSNAKTEPRITDQIYDGCGTTKTCFGIPTNCVLEQSCTAVVTAVNINNKFQFELQSNASGIAYVSLGLSTDMIMGDDSVMDCSLDGGNIRSFSSWNTPRPGLGSSRVGVPQNIATLLEGSFLDGTIYCKLEREAIATKRDKEFNLINDRFHFMVAIGSSVAPDGALTFHNLGRIVSSEPLEIIGRNRNDTIYEGCGTTKTCFGFPTNCVLEQSCTAVVTAVNINNKFQFELQSNASGVAYVSLGLSTDVIMGDDSVMDCSLDGGNNIRSFSSWNTPRPGLGSSREGVPQNITSLLEGSFLDGTIYCKLEREAIATKRDKEFNLINDRFHFMVAVGSSVAPDGALTFHNLGRIVSSEPLAIIGEKIRDPIYDGCGTNKTCFGLPVNCVEQQSCEAIGTAVFIGNRFQFELKSSANNAAYVALALSRDAEMGEDSVMECIPEEGGVRTYSSWNTPRPTLSSIRAGVPQYITTLLSSSFVDGIIYCKLERQGIATKLGTEFNLLDEDFHFMVAIGSFVTPTSITFHNLGRLVSNEPLKIIGRNRNDPIYDGCGTTKTCFGFPENCVEQQSCEAIGTAVFINNRFQFEIETSANDAAYVALALSRDNLMGEDSVMECIPEGGVLRTYSSWNIPRPFLNTVREGVPQDITTLLSSSYVNGTIYCKLERQAISSKLGSEFNLMNENFHFLLAVGNFVTATGIGFHTLGRLASSQPLRIIGLYSDDTIYEDCDDTKICFGLPTDCVERRSCQAIATAAVVNNRYQFEMQSGVDRVAYIALGLSRDNLMGDDSVIECVQQGGAIRSYDSWNTARPSYGNTREGVQQNISTLLDASFVQGTIYCKVERAPITTILGNEFDLVNEDFHFLLAIGSNITGSSVLRHDLGRVGSCQPINLNASADFAKFSIISIVISFLVANYANNVYWL